MNTNKENYQVRLNQPEMLSIMDQNKTYYGGDQRWFTSPFLVMTACGSTAISNMSAYASQNERLKKLYSGKQKIQKNKPVEKNDFLAHMETIARYVRPTIIGIPFLWVLKFGANRYFKRRGLKAKKWHLFHYKPFLNNQLQKTEEYIRTHIENERPIAAIHWLGTGKISIKDPANFKEIGKTNMNFHWVTITGIQKKDGEVYIHVVSSGHPYLFALKDFVKGAPGFAAVEF